MVLLMRANVNNSEMFSAKTDRDMALLAVKYGIELPMHLAHLPTLPAPKTADEMEALTKLAAETEAADNAHAPAEKVKERPPRRTRMRLGHAHEVVDGSNPNTPEVSPAPTPLGSPQATPKTTPREQPKASPKSTPRATGASSDARTAKAKGAAKASAPDSALVVEADMMAGAPVKERAPTTRRKKGTNAAPSSVSPPAAKITKMRI